MHVVTFSKKQKKTIAKQLSLALNNAFPEKGGKKKLAALIGVTPAALSQWKNGSKTPTLQHLFQLSNALGIPLHTLCGVSDMRKLPVGSPVLKHVMALSLIGSMLEKQGKMTPSVRRKLNQIRKALETLEKGGRHTI